MSSKTPIPTISQDLLDYLLKVFPDKLPENMLDASALGELIGQQNVIRHLQAQFKAQQKAGLLGSN